MPEPVTKSWLNLLLERAVQQVGMITVFLTITIFAVTEILFSLANAMEISVLVFGLSGLSEIILRRARSRVNARMKIPDVITNTLRNVLNTDPYINIGVMKEIDYKGFHFKYFGISGQPAALGVSKPLCPSCKNNLIERPRFHVYRYVFDSSCLCGFHYRSAQSAAELMFELMEVRPSQF